MTTTGRKGAKARKVLVAFIGNKDCGDDAVGAITAGILAGRLPSDVELLVRDGDMLSLIEDWAGFDAVICVDAAAPMGEPGRIHRFNLTTAELPSEMSFVSGHTFGLAATVRLARALQLAPQDIIVYAVEGRCFDSGAPMTADVAAALSKVAHHIVNEVDRLRRMSPCHVGIAMPGVVTEKPNPCSLK
jgi:hydrogenase maturation protease